MGDAWRADWFDSRGHPVLSGEFITVDVTDARPGDRVTFTFEWSNRFQVDARAEIDDCAQPFGCYAQHASGSTVEIYTDKQYTIRVDRPVPPIANHIGAVYSYGTDRDMGFAVKLSRESNTGWYFDHEAAATLFPDEDDVVEMWGDEDLVRELIAKHGYVRIDERND